MRRQASAAEYAREGSGPLSGPDPLRLPAAFIASDPAADGGERRVEIGQERVDLQRSVRGVHMHLKLPLQEFLGIAVRVLIASDDMQIHVQLEHRDEALSIPLMVSNDSAASAIAARRWSRALGLPVLIAGEGGRLCNPAAMRNRTKEAPRRRKRSTLRQRRTTMRIRHAAAQTQCASASHAGEREIIART